MARPIIVMPSGKVLYGFHQDYEYENAVFKIPSKCLDNFIPLFKDEIDEIIVKNKYNKKFFRFDKDDIIFTDEYNTESSFKVKNLRSMECTAIDTYLYVDESTKDLEIGLTTPTKSIEILKLIDTNDVVINPNNIPQRDLDCLYKHSNEFDVLNRYMGRKILFNTKTNESIEVKEDNHFKWLKNLPIRIPIVNLLGNKVFKVKEHNH